MATLMKNGTGQERSQTPSNDEFFKTGFSRRDEADMAELGKKQQLNVSKGPSSP
jgi:hypothetical protein